MPFPPGKLPNAVLTRLLARAASLTPDPRVLVGPRMGEDAAVLDWEGQCLVLATDPITFATDQPGWYAVQVNANDVAVRGATPRWFMAVALLPESSTDQALVSSLFDQLLEACRELGCALIGGHTEITLGLDRPIIVGQMIGEVERERLVTTGGAQVGDVLLLTQGIAIEGTALLARELGAALLEGGVSPQGIGRAEKLLFDPGISVVRAALTANSAARVHAMHDPTEGGLATGILELAQASNAGVMLRRDAVHILPDTETVCAALGLDPMGTLASGALLIAVSPDDTARVVDALAQERIPCAPIGSITPAQEGLRVSTPQGVIDLPTFARDEVTRVL